MVLINWRRLGRRPRVTLRAPAPPHPLAEALERRTLLAFGPAGPEFRVNTFTANGQLDPSAAALPGGGSVVAWESALQDGSGYGVYAQRYGANGARAGAEFQLNTTTFRWQVNPAVAADADGDFVVVWQNHENDFEADVFARRFSAAGVPQTGEVVINAIRGGDQGRPAVALSPGGDGLVAWDAIQDGDGRGIVARRLTADGAPVGDEIPVNTTTPGQQMFPAVAALAGAGGTGGFVVAWKSSGPANPGTTATFARRFDAAGEPLGDEILVAETPFTGSEPPALAATADGGFVVAWGTYENQAGVFSGDVYARRYAADGQPRGGAFVVNETVAGAQTEPAAAADADGNLVIAWTNFAADTGENDVYARRFGPDGTPAGGDFRVGTATDAVQSAPAVAAGADGDCLIAWQGNPAGSVAFDVYAQRYRDARPTVSGVFVDGSRWTTAFRSLLAGSGLGSAAFGFAVPAAGPVITVPWVNLDRVSVRFSDDAVVGSGDLAVRGVSVPNYPVTGFTYDPANRTATWTLGRSLAADKVQLALGGAAAGAAGDLRLRLDVLPGDVNGDRAVNALDLLALRRRQSPGSGTTTGPPLPYAPTHDLDGDGDIDRIDQVLLRRALLSRLPAQEPTR